MLRLLVFSLLPIFCNPQYFGPPVYFYQPQQIVPQLAVQAPINYYQPVHSMPMTSPYQQYPAYNNYPQYESYHHAPQYGGNYPINYPINVQTSNANSLANMLLLRELENSRNGGNEFRDREGAFEEQSRLFNIPVGPNEHSKYLSLIGDKDNFQVSGCSWDLMQMKCVDGLGLCKGGCRDFAVTTTATLHDCRCIPYGYAALLKLAGK